MGSILLLGEKRDPILTIFEPTATPLRDPWEENSRARVSKSTPKNILIQKINPVYPGFHHAFLMILGAKKGPEIAQKQAKKQARIEMMISLILLAGTMK